MVKARQLMGQLSGYKIETADLGYAGVEVTVGGRKVEATAAAVRRAAGDLANPTSQPRRAVLNTGTAWDGREWFNWRRRGGTVEVGYAGGWYARDVCGNRCNMCRTINRRLSIAKREQTSWKPKAGQEPSTVEAIASLLKLLNLGSCATFADIGAGDGRVLSAVGKTCKLSIGIEIDPAVAAEARRRIAAAGLSDRVRIFEGDARWFDPVKHKVTHGYAHLMPDVLERLKPMLAKIPKLVTSHAVPGWDGKEVDGLYVYGG